MYTEVNDYDFSLLENACGKYIILSTWEELNLEIREREIHVAMVVAWLLAIT